MTQGEIEIVIALTSHSTCCVKLELLQKHTQMVYGSKIKKNPHFSPECYNDTAQ